jgi:alpha-ketoglutarate-dependent taurine dioxygenase
MCRHSQSVGAPKIKNFSQETFPDEAAEVVGKEALLHISWRFLSKMPSWSTLDSKNSPTMTYKFKFLGNF